MVLLRKTPTPVARRSRLSLLAAAIALAWIPTAQADDTHRVVAKVDRSALQRGDLEIVYKALADQACDKCTQMVRRQKANSRNHDSCSDKVLAALINAINHDGLTQHHADILSQRHEHQHKPKIS